MQLPEFERRLAYATALLHDIGHAPLSHSLEPMFEEAFELNHHGAATEILMGRVEIGREINRTLVKYKIDPEQIIALLSGKNDPFDRFFSGPINFDTIEAVSRARQYIKKDAIGPSPTDILSAAMERNVGTNRQIVDKFWEWKNQVYKLLIRSPEGVLTDFLCQRIVRAHLHKVSRFDFFSTESAFFSKVPDLKSLLVHNKMSVSQPVAEIHYNVRCFYIDYDALLFVNDDNNRYKQRKYETTLSLCEDRSKNSCVEEWDLFDDVRNSEGETLFGGEARSVKESASNGCS